jgi:TPR repeat protein
MYWLGFLYDMGLGVNQNYTTAKYWYEKAAEKGETRAMNNLGYMYDEGHGVTQNFTTAKYWYEKAAGKGEATAMHNLG